MRAAWRWPGLLAIMLVLAACGGRHATRPAAGGAAGKVHHGWFHHDSVSDDTSLPQSRRYRDNDDSTPAGAPPAFIATLPEPVPKVEPRALYGNKSPYSVRGQSYRVLPSARGYDERGIASYYGNKFNGYKTSSLENYDMYKFSAASKVLPRPAMRG
ncbi:rare lipoprotein A [Rhodanobacter sp. 115]|nr:rare lipoprotein A [Rhodanobacter sp. 115]